MADISFTATAVVQGASASIENGTAGATIAQGKTVYRDPADGKFKLAHAVTSSLTATVYGIALNSASDGQPLQVLTDGLLTLGSGLAVGEVYVQSGANAGGIAPASDLTAGTTWRASVIGVSTSASVLKVRFINSDTVNP